MHLKTNMLRIKRKTHRLNNHQIFQFASKGEQGSCKHIQPGYSLQQGPGFFLKLIGYDLIFKNFFKSTSKYKFGVKYF